VGREGGPPSPLRPAHRLTRLHSMANLGLMLPRPPPAVTQFLPISCGDHARASCPDGDPSPSTPLRPGDSKPFCAPAPRRLSHPPRRRPVVVAPFFDDA
jgi:hypothetical protein